MGAVEVGVGVTVKSVDSVGVGVGVTVEGVDSVGVGDGVGVGVAVDDCGSVTVADTYADHPLISPAAFTDRAVYW